MGVKSRVALCVEKLNRVEPAWATRVNEERFTSLTKFLEMIFEGETDAGLLRLGLDTPERRRQHGLAYYATETSHVSAEFAALRKGWIQQVHARLR